MACAVAGASTMMMDGSCSAGTFIAADYATNSIYGSGWSAGQNGGYGFGAWSFDGTVSGMTNVTYPDGIPNPGDQQAISSGSKNMIITSGSSPRQYWTVDGTR